ncbi:MAG: squalene synthase HpnC [Ignavibacteriales bacterium]|nr:squalene synthase HpnC [Ignavibacteriales bacterium]
MADIKNEYEALYNKAIQFTQSHYENFPVLSFFIAKHLRKHVAVIYQFARQADDLADEGNDSKEKRLVNLSDYEDSLTAALNGNYKSDFWKVLHLTVTSQNLTPKYFYDLLDAFKQDVVKNKYSNYEELLDYCRRSANPVGRLILELNNIKDEKANFSSDFVCTALQLTNFYQDVSVDILKDRIYIPEKELNKFSITEDEINNKKFSNEFKELIKFQTKRAGNLFLQGRNLLKFLPLRLKFQILVTIKGGESILKKIKKLNYNILENRPTLSKMDFIKIFLQAMLTWR